MPHAMDEERILLAHDFRGHFQDGLRPLVEAARQPVGVLQTFGQKVLLRLAPGVAGDTGKVDIID